MLSYNTGILEFLSSDILSSTKNIVCGFQPKALKFTWVGTGPATLGFNTFSNNDIRRGVGFATSTTNRNCVSSFSDHGNATASDCGSAWSTTCCVMLVNGAGASVGKLDISSIDIDSFTLIVDQVATTSCVVKWEAWGGSDITNVTIGNIAEPAVSGVASYTASGFIASPFIPDQCVMFAGVQSVSATDVVEQQDSGLYIGFATSSSTANNIVISANSDDASASQDTQGYNFTGACITQMVIAGGNPSARAQLSSYGADTFTLNWLLRTTSNRRSIYMAIKGGSWAAGSVTINGNTLNSTATISGVPFRVRGGCLMGTMRTPSSAGASTAEDRIGYGSFRFGKGVNDFWQVDNYIYRSYMTCYDQNLAATSTCSVGYNELAALGYSSAGGGELTKYDVSFGGNSATLTTATAGGVAGEWVGYLLFGDNTAMSSVGHPFIS